MFGFHAWVPCPYVSNYHLSGRRPALNKLAALQQNQTATGEPITIGMPAEIPDVIESDEYAVEYYYAYGARLVELGLMQPDFGELLALLAGTLADLRRATDEHRAQGYPMTQSVEYRGSVTVRNHPLVKLTAELRAQAQRLLNEWGLSPSMQAKLAKARKAGTTKEPWEDLTAGPPQ